MKMLVVGLGSMGKRRVRNLQALGLDGIAGFDLRADRLAEARDKYGINTYASFDEALALHQPDALVISTGPKWHMQYAFAAAERKLPCFIEASVVDAERILELSELVAAAGPVMAPSCTMRYFPGPKKVKELLASGVIGKPLNINYQTGQYLPDWHPWEAIEDYYVSERDTGAGREIVPFELTWLNDIFGHPAALACVKAKLSDMNAEIDDVYHCLLQYPGKVLANVTVEVLSRPFANRTLRILGSAGQIVMDADEACVRYASVAEPELWHRFPFAGGTVESGYINPEEPYIAEMADYVAAVTAKDQSKFPNSLKDDWNVLQTLHALESLCPETK